MDQGRIETEGARPAGFFGMREDAQLPVPAQASTGLSGAPRRARRSWLGIATRIVRDAPLAVPLLASVPTGIAALTRHRVFSSPAASHHPCPRTPPSATSTPPPLPTPAATPHEAMRRGSQVGVKRYVSKPVQFEAFAQKVSEMGLYWLIINNSPVAA